MQSGTRQRWHSSSRQTQRNTQLVHCQISKLKIPKLISIRNHLSLLVCFRLNKKIYYIGTLKISKSKRKKYLKVRMSILECYEFMRFRFSPILEFFKKLFWRRILCTNYISTFLPPFNPSKSETNTKLLKPYKFLIYISY